jgi:hypothetical protein
MLEALPVLLQLLCLQRQHSVDGQAATSCKWFAELLFEELDCCAACTAGTANIGLPV